MNKITQSDDLVKTSQGQVMTTSRVVAERFGKDHKNVLRDIKNLDCSAEYHRLNFEQVLIDVPGHRGAIRKMPMYNITRDGFIFLVTGFNGKKAAAWKEKFIGAFNAMEKELLRITIQRNDAHWQQVRAEGKNIRLVFTDVIQEFVGYAKKQGSQNAEKYYMNITKMECKALEFVKQSGDKNFRDTLDVLQHSQLMVIEYAAQQALREGMDEGLHYKDCFQKAKQACLDLAMPLKLFTGKARSARIPIAHQIAVATAKRKTPAVTAARALD